MTGATVLPPTVPPLVVFVINAKTGATVWAEISTRVPVKRLKRYLWIMLFVIFFCQRVNVHSISSNSSNRAYAYKFDLLVA